MRCPSRVVYASHLQSCSSQELPLPRISSRVDCLQVALSGIPGSWSGCLIRRARHAYVPRVIDVSEIRGRVSRVWRVQVHHPSLSIRSLISPRSGSVVRPPSWTYMTGCFCCVICWTGPVEIIPGVEPHGQPMMSDLESSFSFQTHAPVQNTKHSIGSYSYLLFALILVVFA